MKKLLIGLVVFLLSSVALAEEQPKTSSCGSMKDIFEHFMKLDSAPTIVALIETPQGPNAMTIWQTEKGEHWAIVVTNSEGKSCIVQTGTKMISVPFKLLNTLHDS